MKRMLAVVDTNTLLHFRSFKEIEWPELLGTDDVVLIFARVVLHELDEHKAATPRLRARATRVLRDLNAMIDSRDFEVRKAVTADLRGRDADDATFGRYQLNPRWADDRLMAFVLELREELRADDHLVIVTSDTGLKVKAHNVGIRAQSLPEKLALAPDPDPRDKELATVKARLQELQERQPEVTVGLSPGELSVRPPESVARFSDGFEARYAQALVRVAKLRREDAARRASGHAVAALELAAIAQPRLGVWEKYVDSMLEFKNEVRRQHALRREFVRVSPIITNEGKGDAGLIHCVLSFPEGAQIREEADLPSGKSLREPPEPSASMGNGYSSEILEMERISPRRDPSHPRIEGSVVRVDFDGLMHGMQILVAPFYVRIAVGGSIVMDWATVVEGGAGDREDTITITPDANEAGG